MEISYVASWDRCAIVSKVKIVGVEYTIQTEHSAYDENLYDAILKHKRLFKIQKEKIELRMVKVRPKRAKKKNKKEGE